MTETIENLPSEPYVVLDPGTSIFSIARTSDPEFLGVYNVKITSQFDQLNIDKSSSVVT